MTKQRWVRIIGDGLAFSGPCLLTHVLLYPDANHDYTDIYDGRDTAAGKKFIRMQSSTRTIRHLSFNPGVPFDVGIYIDGYDSEVETTVVFIPN